MNDKYPNIYPGATFGKLSVTTGKILTSLNYKTGIVEPIVECKCSCNRSLITAFVSELESGAITSCPRCTYEDPCGRRVDPRLHCLWSSMIARCRGKNNTSYAAYGAKGVDVCPEWNKYEPFRDWAMENGYDTFAKRDECTLDRIDPTRGYSPDNCRFINIKDQANNKTNNTIFNVDGVQGTLSEFANALGLTQQLLCTRINMYNKSIEEALFTPPTKGNLNGINCIYFVDNNGRPISPEQYESGNR